MRSKIKTLPAELLETMWESIDWKQAEARLAELQEQLSAATVAHDHEEQLRLESLIVNDFDIRCLAVRHVGKSQSGPGVDKIRWKTNADLMRAALELIPEDYEAKPLRLIIMKSKSTGKERKVGLPTYYDRAMCRLYSYALAPITEARAERKSFAFRKGRSAQDAQSYILECLNRDDAPNLVVVADIESFYATIQHDWIMKHVPMDKHVLHEMLKAGIIFAGAMFESGDEGISPGSNISPYIANYVLDGLQKHIYQNLYGDKNKVNYNVGNLIRFADDILVTVKSYEQGYAVMAIIEDFLRERGLRLSPEKSRVKSLDEGFIFLAQTYRKVDGMVHCYPSDETVERFIRRLVDTIDAHKKSQRELIEKLNLMLNGWANYHRFSEATQAFYKVDIALQTALLEDLMKKHPRRNVRDLIDTYFYKENGRHYYAISDDVSIRVIKLEDTILVRHHKVKTNLNPFLEPDYVEKRTQEREIENVSGPYKAVWKSQKGRCHYCGHKILLDQPKTVVQLDLSKPESPENSAYIHKICAANELEIVETMDPLTSYVPYDVLEVLKFIASEMNIGTHVRLPENWRYMPLKEYFSHRTEASLTLTFLEIETILGKELPPSAYKYSSFWRGTKGVYCMADAWISENYELTQLRLDKRKARFKRKKNDLVKVIIPKEITEQKIPDDAAYEINRFMVHIIKKYNLSFS